MSARGQTLSFSWEKSRRGTQSNRVPNNLPIFGKRKNASNPNEPSEFFVARPF